jgi:hypothetical protein
MCMHKRLNINVYDWLSRKCWLSVGCQLGASFDEWLLEGYSEAPYLHHWVEL